MSAHTKKALRSISENPNAVESEFPDLPISRIHGDWYLSLFGTIRPDADWTSLKNFGAIRGAEINGIATVKVPLPCAGNVDYSDVFTYLEVPAKVSPDLNRARYDTRTNQVHAGIDLPQGFHGEGVVIGITDWGYDYTHPMLYDTLLQQTRILAAWDQFKQVGTPPDGFGYGAQYVGESQLLAAQGDTSNIYGYNTHGMHVAGIAAGGGAGMELLGIAPAANLLLNTFLIDAASVIDAFVWMKSLADEAQKRLVVNMSWGLYHFGTLDGSSLLSQAIDALSEEGVVFVTSAGNNGSDNFHIRKEFSGDTIHSRITFANQTVPNLWGQRISMWGDIGNSFHTSLRILSSNNIELAATPYYHTANVDAYIDSFLVVNNDTIYFDLATDAIHPQSGRPGMSLRVRPFTGLYKAVISSTAESGVVHYWNVIELTTGVGNWGYAFMNPGMAGGVAGDPEYGIGEPACTSSVLAVAAHAPEYLTQGGTLVGGGLASFSSRGPLISGVMKPDVSGPGVNIESAVSSFTNSSYLTSSTVMFNGTQYPFSRFSGTSMSSPSVAGIAALVLSANSNLSSSQVSDIIKATARLDSHTGSISAPGHTRWGMGKANALAAVQLALGTVGIDEYSLNDIEFNLFPNPAHTYATISIPGEPEILSIRAIDSTGRIHSVNTKGFVMDLTGLASGMYLIVVQTENGILKVHKLMVE